MTFDLGGTTLRVAIVGSELGPSGGGAAAVALTAAAGLSERGFQVKLISTDENPPTADLPWDRLSRSVIADIHRCDVVLYHRVRRISHRIRGLLTSGPPGVMTLHDSYLSCAVSLRIHGDGSLCTLDRCDIQTLFLRKCGFESGPKRAVSAAEFWTRPLVYGEFPAVEFFIAPSSFVLEHAVPRLGDRSRFRLLRNPVPRSTLVRPLAIQPRAGVCFFGRLERGKGLEALEAMAERGIVVDCFGSVKGRVPRLLNYHGEIPRDDVPEQLSRYRVVVVPSYYPENCPMIVLEAFACRTAVVSFDSGGLHELVGNGRGIVVPRGDIEALLGGVQRLLQSDAEWTSCTERARVLAEECSEDNYLSSLTDLIHDARRDTYGPRRTRP